MSANGIVWDDTPDANRGIASLPTLTRTPQPATPSGIVWDDERPQQQPTLQRPATSDHSTLGDLGRSALGALEKGAGAAVRGVGDIGQKIDEAIPLSRKLDELTGLTPERTQAAGQVVEQAGAKEAANVSPEFAAKTSQPILSRTGFNPTNIANKAINSVASMTPALAASLVPYVGPVLGAATFGAQG